MAEHKPPYRKTIRRRGAALDERKITAAREGANVARERYDRVSRSPAIKEALERVQIDHPPVDLIVADSGRLFDRRPRPGGSP
jgi:putative transposase